MSKQKPVFRSDNSFLNRNFFLGLAIGIVAGLFISFIYITKFSLSSKFPPTNFFQKPTSQCVIDCGNIDGDCERASRGPGDPKYDQCAVEQEKCLAACRAAPQPISGKEKMEACANSCDNTENTCTNECPKTDIKCSMNCMTTNMDCIRACMN